MHRIRQKALSLPSHVHKNGKKQATKQIFWPSAKDIPQCKAVIYRLCCSHNHRCMEIMLIIRSVMDLRRKHAAITRTYIRENTCRPAAKNADISRIHHIIQPAGTCSELGGMAADTGNDRRSDSARRQILARRHCPGMSALERLPQLRIFPRPHGSVGRHEMEQRSHERMLHAYQHMPAAFTSEFRDMEIT